MITPKVEEEVAVLEARYPDGVVAGERIAWGTLQVVPLAARQWVQHLTADALGDGEKETMELCGQGAEGEALVTEDSRACVTATRLGLPAWMLPDVVRALAERGHWAVEVAEAILAVIRPRYHVGVIAHSMVRTHISVRGGVA